MLASRRVDKSASAGDRARLCPRVFSFRYPSETRDPDMSNHCLSQSATPAPMMRIWDPIFGSQMRIIGLNLVRPVPSARDPTIPRPTLWTTLHMRSHAIHLRDLINPIHLIINNRHRTSSHHHWLISGSAVDSRSLEETVNQSSCHLAVVRQPMSPSRSQSVQRRQLSVPLNASEVSS